MGQQAPKMRTEVQTGSSPTQLASGAVKPPNTVTSERVGQLTDSRNPLMQRAATQGMQYAQSRGLLNSSLAAQASQGAVLDRSIELSARTCRTSSNQFYAGLDMKKFESDSNYRDRALAQEKEISESQIGEQARQFDVRQGFDERRFQSDEGYRRDQMALEERLADTRQEFDRERFRSDEAYRRDVLSEDSRRFDVRQDFDERRFQSDEGYRNSVMEQADRHFGSRLDFDRERFETDEVYRRDLMEQQREFETRRLDLVEEENEFRRTFDRTGSSLTSNTAGTPWPNRSPSTTAGLTLPLNRLGLTGRG